MNRRDVFGGNRRQQPGENESKDRRRMVKRKMIRGKEKYQARPRTDWQPILDPRFPVMPSVSDAHRPWRLLRAGAELMA
jgi:hypothetical protein